MPTQAQTQALTDLTNRLQTTGVNTPQTLTLNAAGLVVNVNDSGDQLEGYRIVNAIRDSVDSTTESIRFEVVMTVSQSLQVSYKGTKGTGGDIDLTISGGSVPFSISGAVLSRT